MPGGITTPRTTPLTGGIPGRLPDAVEHWPVDRLKPYAGNARTHSADQVAQIAASIVEFGWTNPILVDREGGVVAGHGRVLAARLLGLDIVPVLRLDHLTPTQRRAYVIADNQLALNAGWDEALLAAEVGDLKLDGFDLGLLGFAEDELDRLLDGVDGGGTQVDEDDVPDVPAQAVTLPGDLWVLGKHRLLCGDATSPADLDRVLEAGLADMVFTDPPYNVGYEGKTSKRMRIANDELGDSFGTFLETACRNMLRVCKGSLYVCMSSSEVGTLKAAFEAAGGHWSTFIVWAKSSFTLGRADYQRQYEPILYGWQEGADHYWCGARDQGDVWEYPRPNRNDLHPTMKPVALVERAIRNSSKSRDTVLDPFAGSGTTLMAAEASGRRAALVELDPGYCDVIVERWQRHTGGAAVLDGSGHSFGQIKTERVAA